MSSDRSITQNAWYGIFTQAVDKFFPVLIVLYLARTLDAEQFGLYSFLVAYLAFFQIVAEQSLDTVLIRMASQHPERRVPLFQAALGLRLLIALMAATTAVLLVGPASGGTAPVGLTVVAAIGLVTAMGGAYRAFFRAALNIRAVLVIAAVRAILLVSAIVSAMSLWPGLTAVFGATAAANLITVLCVAWAVRHEAPPTPRLDRQAWHELLSGVWPIAGNALAITASLRAGQVILMSLRGPVEVGLFAAASRVVEAFSVLPEALMIAIYPLMASLHGSDGDRLLATARRSTRYLVAIVGLPVIACVAAGPEVMSLLFGERFADAGIALALLSGMAVLSATGTVLQNLLIAIHHERVLYWDTLAFAFVNVAICFPLIASYGYLGAALAMVATSLASQVVLLLVPSVRQAVRACLAGALSPIAATALSLSAVLLPLPTTGQVLAAGFVYAAALWLLGGFRPADVRVLRGVC